MLTKTVHIADELLLLIDTADAPIISIDKSDRIKERNKNISTISGFNKDEVIGRDLMDHSITDDQ